MEENKVTPGALPSNSKNATSESNAYLNNKENAAPPKQKNKQVVQAINASKKVDGTAVEQKSFIRKFIKTDAHSLKKYAVDEVIIPTVVNGLFNIAMNTLSMTLLGKKADSRDIYSHYRGGSGVPGGRVSYRDYYDSRDARDVRPTYMKTTDYADVRVRSQEDADVVLDMLNEQIRTYGSASVADLYELVGLDTPYTSNKYGWTRIGNARVVRYGDEYVIDMPRPMPL